MTRSPEDEARALLGTVADRMPDSPGLLDAVHARARRTVRRRRAAAGGVLAVTTAVTAVAVLLPGTDGGTDGGTVAPVDVATAPPAPAVPAVPSATTPHGTGPAVTATSPGAPSAAASARPSRAGGPAAPERKAAAKPAWTEDFSGPLDRARWTAVYTSGENTPLSSWDAANVAVSGGAAHLAVIYTGASPRPATSGGIGAETSAARTGRWEARMRMSSGTGVVGQFVLVGADGSSPRYLASLFGDGTFSVSDEAARRSADTRAATGSWHTVRLTLTAGSVRWTLDGAIVADWPSRPGAQPVWPAFQTLMPGPDCGAATLPADCGGRRTAFPQELSVDRLHFWAG